MDESITSCPHCGSRSGYYKRVFVYGWVEFAYGYGDKTSDDKTVRNRVDSLQTNEDQTVYCVDCEEELGNLTP